MSATCPVCGDSAVYALWADKTPPLGCPLNAKTVTACEFQMAKAKQAALFRMARPDCFDENGTIKPGTIGWVIAAAMEAEPDHELIIGGGIPEPMYRRAGIKIR